MLAFGKNEKHDMTIILEGKFYLSKNGKQVLDFPTYDDVSPGDNRRGTSDNLMELCSTEMNRYKTYAIIDLFQ